MSALETIIAALQQRRRALAQPYYVPGLWVDAASTAAQPVDPYAFYAGRLREIQQAEPVPLVQGEGGGEWSRHARAYNLFPRVTTAFDHEQDGRLAIGPSADGWRDTGTLLKCIALLPYLQSMEITAIHLLPISAVGQDGRKGSLGSPYAIRDPYRLDENLDEPALGLDVDTLFAGFVEAAHRLGIRVVMEFVLRTAAKDSDWIAQHPDWFYWIRADIPDRRAGSLDASVYGAPIFPPDDLHRAKAKVYAHDFTALPAPPKAYRAMFTHPPRPENVRREDGRWIGALDDGTRVRVPGAFSDYPPDDTQPPWTDVTYLRLYDHPDFNYMAYNTIRMYDRRLAKPEHAVSALWDAVAGVIPHYQQRFGIDGVMIDMGHALPPALRQRVLRSAREINPDFAFWGEDFSIDSHSAAEGYNAVVGFLLFDLHQPDRLREFLRKVTIERLPVPFFATAENHNTPRAYSRPFPLEFVHYALAISVMLPGIPYIHSGFELMETKPINTGLNFSREALRANPTDTLPLFSPWAFDWTRRDNLVGSIRYAFGLRKKYDALLSNPDPATAALGYGDNPNLIVFVRRNHEHALIAVASSSMETVESGRAHVPVTEYELTPLWGTEHPFRSVEMLSFDVRLGNGHVLILEDGKALGQVKAR
jgi:glycosidase